MSDNDSSSIYEAIEADIENYLQIIGNGELGVTAWRSRPISHMKLVEISICSCNCSHCQNKPAKPIRLLTLYFEDEIISIEINNIIQQTLNIHNENFTEELYNIIKQEYRQAAIYHNLRNRRSQA